jgi:hypothetical protein
LAVTRSRALTVAELRRIRLRLRWSVATAAGWLLGVPLALALCAVGITLSPTPYEAIGAIVVFLGLLLGVPLCILMSNDYFKRASALRRQCRDSEVLVCEGVVADLALARREREKLRRELGQRTAVVLEVLRIRASCGQSTATRRNRGSWCHEAARRGPRIRRGSRHGT